MSEIEPDCAICGASVAPDTDHVKIEGEHLPRREWANVDEYYAHPDCWREVTDEWLEPA
jgi:hypothetical protein